MHYAEGAIFIKQECTYIQSEGMKGHYVLFA